MTGTKLMKFKSNPWVCFFLLTMVAMLGGNMMAAEETPNNMVVIQDVEGVKETRITVNLEEEFSIKIKSNPTTGYSWGVEISEEDPLVKLKEKKVIEPGDQSPKLLGAPTYELFTFESLGTGETVIQLNYQRPWEKDTPAEKKHKVLVTIQ